VFSDAFTYVLILDAARTLQASTFMSDTHLRRPFLLPREIRVSYERHLAACRRAWEATQDPLAVAEAITWAHHFRQPIEIWIEEAAVRALVRVRSKASHRKHRENMLHFERWRTVRDLVESGQCESVEEAVGETVTILEQLGRVVDEETVKRFYKKVRRDMLAQRGDRYFYLKADARYGSHLG
jgi:hypothetical protein